MKTLWYIAKKDLRQVLKDRSSLLLLLVVPLALIAVVGFAFGNVFGDGSTQIQIKVAVSNQDTGQNAYIGKAIVNALKINTNQLVITVNDYSDSGQVTKQVTASNSPADVGIVIPAGASGALMTATQQGTMPKNLVQFYTLPNNNDARITIVQNVVNSVISSQLAGSTAIGQVNKVCHQPGNHCDQSTIDNSAINTAVAQASASSDQAVQSLTAGQAVKVGPFDQTVPGYAIFFSLFGLNAAAATILQEKEDGTFRRLLIAPIQKYALLGGKLLAQFILTLAQLLVLFLVGYFVFKMHIDSWPTVILMLIGTSFAATGLGILLVSIVKTRRQLNPVITLVTLITSAIGGAWWPLFIEPTWMQQVAKVGITAWAMEGLNATMIFGKGFMEVLPDILGLLAYGTICFVIALRFFRFQEKAA
ncbi:MAG: ABC transporter permease [Ktedonobacteraceae bacterium]|nr:ABC transporter permease [Ktedonobacteraceae bacterium]MBO0791497.1 ABC transporter permease [Ktedonobacteraceae bacterium]